LPPKTQSADATAAATNRVAAVAEQAGSTATPPPIPLDPPHAVNDPLAEGAKVVWYVRLASGEQLGPAGADAMRGWLAEGRITADALVWREGWRDWRSAGSLFLQLSPSPIPGLETIVNEPLVTPIHPHHATPHAPPRRTQFAVIGGLLLLLLLLVTVFLIASRQ
jgi:hypothetical protein